MSSPPIEVIRNTARGDRAIEFIQKLKITKGKRAGQPFILTPWQAQFVRDIIEPADATSPQTRLVNKGIFSVSRKNGKSELAAALVLLFLIGPECEPNAQIVSGATSQEQARVVFDKVVEFINASVRPGYPNSGLLKYLRVIDSRSRIIVKGSDTRARGSRYTAISAKHNAAHGKDPTLVIFDELAQAHNRKFFDSLISAQGARDEPLMFIISTQHEDPSHVLSTQIDEALENGWSNLRTADQGPPLNPRTVCHLYTAEPGCDLNDPVALRAANPALGDWIDEGRLIAEAEEAMRSRSEEAQFRLYKLNQRISATAPFLSRDDWMACQAPNLPAVHTRKQDDLPFEPGERLHGGLDMSWRRDLTALAMASAERPLVKCWFYKNQKYLIEHGRVDGQEYEIAAANGFLVAVPGETIDPTYVAQTVIALNERHRVAGIAYDPNKIDEFIRFLDLEGAVAQDGEGPGIRLVRWSQTYPRMAVALDALEASVLNRRIMHDGNPILTWNMANALLDAKPNGKRFTKTADKFRIDGAVATALALGFQAEDIGERGIRNPYEDETFSVEQWF